MLESLTAKHFQALVDQTVAIDFNAAEPHAAKVISVREGKGGHPDRPPFSVLFQGPAGALYAQRIYDVSHPSLGQVALFLVPIGADDDGHGLYEAVFG